MMKLTLFLKKYKSLLQLECNEKVFIIGIHLALLAGAAEYTDCFSAES